MLIATSGADEINVYERLISNGTGRNQAVRYAEAEGLRIKELYQKYITDLNLPNLKIIRWKEIQDEKYEKTVAQLRDNVSTDSSLAQLLRETAIFYIKRRNPSVTINDRRINHFQDYLLNEMVVQLHGIKESKIIYHAVYINRLEDAALYQSPVLDLKCAFKKVYGGCDAYTSRVFISSPTLAST
ncbi:MAG: hypothetical protein EOP45_06255 [Sphingobacteriaceae bacterium]|nr:MAG: hypothetical protein EOP45_06255 [Sphingobacteriaceae bacterium]